VSGDSAGILLEREMNGKKHKKTWMDVDGWQKSWIKLYD